MKFYLVNHEDGHGLLYSEEAEYNLFIDEKEVLTWNYKGRGGSGNLNNTYK